MKIVLHKAIAGLLLAAATAVSACQQAAPSGTAATASAPEMKPAAKVAAKPYVCPMGCEGSESDKPGKCPTCGMELTKNPAYKPSGATKL